MKIDYRIMGRPYRGSRRVVAMITGFGSRSEAETRLVQGIEGGWIDPEGYVGSHRVGDSFVGQDHTTDIRAEIEVKQ